jgi:crotonobetainyl-CoA:carnitine CoA-transferase CaiB-like acyl-CoA transferase
VAGTFAAMATMFAIYERDQGGSGKGQEVDVSLYEPMFRLAKRKPSGTTSSGGARAHRQPVDDRFAAQRYETRDGRYITISASTQKSFDRLVDAMGMPSSRSTSDLPTVQAAAQRRRSRTS